jgi:hypothetical protein
VVPRTALSTSVTVSDATAMQVRRAYRRGAEPQEVITADTYMMARGDADGDSTMFREPRASLSRSVYEQKRTSSVDGAPARPQLLSIESFGSQGGGSAVTSSGSVDAGPRAGIGIGLPQSKEARTAELHSYLHVSCAPHAGVACLC